MRARRVRGDAGGATRRVGLADQPLSEAVTREQIDWPVTTLPEHTPRSTTMLESALRQDRAVRGVVLILIPLACWSWMASMARDMYGMMLGPSAWMRTPAWEWPHVLLLWAMWAVMMAAMMLPSAAPIVL